MVNKEIDLNSKNTAQCGMNGVNHNTFKIFLQNSPVFGSAFQNETIIIYRGTQKKMQ